MRSAIYAGVNSAVLTPMRNDLSVDIDRMAQHCRWLLANGCDGLGVLGTTGEANSLGMQERVEVLEGLVQRGISPTRLLPGVGTTAIPDTVALIRKAAALGCPGVLVLPPFFYKNPSDDGLVAYFSEIIERAATGTKIYLYHFPAQSAVPFGVDLVGRLLKAFPNTVRGIKDSSGDIANTKAYIDHFAKDGFEVYCADDSTLLETLEAGGAGCVTGAANVGSAVSARVYANWDKPGVAEIQATLTAIRRAVITAPLIPGLKALLARHSADDSWNNVRPPFTRLSREAAAKLFAAFDACGITLARAA